MATVRYPVDDVEAATRFYTERLGFTIAERWGGALTIVVRDHLRLLLSGPQTSAPAVVRRWRKIRLGNPVELFEPASKSAI